MKYVIIALLTMSGAVFAGHHHDSHHDANMRQEEVADDNWDSYNEYSEQSRSSNMGASQGREPAASERPLKRSGHNAQPYGATRGPDTTN